jgi:hypothetical protein
MNRVAVYLMTLPWRRSDDRIPARRGEAGAGSLIVKSVAESAGNCCTRMNETRCWEALRAGRRGQARPSLGGGHRPQIFQRFVH